MKQFTYTTKTRDSTVYKTQSKQTVKLTILHCCGTLYILHLQQRKANHPSQPLQHDFADKSSDDRASTHPKWDYNGPPNPNRNYYRDYYFYLLLRKSVPKINKLCKIYQIEARIKVLPLKKHILNLT